MNPITAYVQSLGNEGAVLNARRSIETRVLEDWLVEGLVRRLDAIDLETRPTQVAIPAV